MTPNFCVTSSGDSTTSNKWFHHCKRQQIPYVVVRVRRKFASVNWDCISLPPDWDAAVVENPSVERQLLAAFEQFANRQSRYSFSTWVGGFDNLLPLDAEAAAAQICNILQNAVDSTGVRA